MKASNTLMRWAREPSPFLVLLSVALLLGAVPSAFADTKPFRVKVRFVDAAGAPVAGVAVQVFQDQGHGPFGRGELELKQTRTTGTDGALELTLPRTATLLLARKAGLATTWHQIRNPGKNPQEEVVLRPPQPLAGRVVDQGNKPVANATVWVRASYLERPAEGGAGFMSYLRSPQAREAFLTRTDAEGRFRFDDFPPEATADLGLSATGKFLREPQREFIGPETMLFRSGQQNIRLAVEPAGLIEGKVVAEETGAPVPGARLSLSLDGSWFSRRDGLPVESDAAGFFRMDGVAPGSYQIQAAFGTNELPAWVAEAVPVSVEAGQTVKEVRVVAKRGGLLEAAVVDEASRGPVEQANFTATSEHFRVQARTGTNGTVRLRLPPGEYALSASRDGFQVASGGKTQIETGKTNRATIDLAPPTKITGIVRDPAGAPVSGLALQVFPAYGSSEGSEVVTDASGRYELFWNPLFGLGMRDQKCALIGLEAARNLAVAQDLDPGITNLDLKLEPGLVLAGQVRDPEGKPLTHAEVQVVLWGSSMGSDFGKPAHTDAQGRFEIATLPPERRYSLWIGAKGYGRVGPHVQREGDSLRVELEPVTLKPTDRKIVGQVLDPDEKPVVRASINVQGEGQPYLTVRSDEQGRFSCDVCEGSVRLYARGQQLSSTSMVVQGGDTNVVIRLALRSTPGRSVAPPRPSLVSKALPSLADLGFPPDAVPTNRPTLLCLIDLEQRPSRRVLRQLADQHEALCGKGLAVLGLQATVLVDSAFQDLKTANPVPFAIGRVVKKNAGTRWVTQPPSLPWLILVDKHRQVAAEGFAFDELDTKLKEIAK